MKKYKIGLINVQNIDNYGANLIAFALEKEIDYLLPDSEYKTINYLPKQINLYNIKGLSETREWFRVYKIINKKPCSKTKFLKVKFSKAKYNIRSCLARIVHKEKYNNGNVRNLRQENFNLFRKNVLHMSAPFKSSKEVSIEPFDIYIIGSDVVWKPMRLLGNEHDVYFGNFNHGKKR